MGHKDIALQVSESDSYKELQAVISTMKGKTFHHHIHVLHDLRCLLGAEPKTYMEIGSYCGASACLMLKHHLPTNIICIDPLNLPSTHYGVNESQEDVLRFNINKFNASDRDAVVFKNFSSDPELHEKLEGMKVDILFIDGDHGRIAVQKDFINFHNMVNPGGFIVFDDYLDDKHSPQVRGAVDYICEKIKENNLPYEQIGLIKNYQNSKPVESDMLNEFILQRR